jgi:hypothetical protein
MNACLSPTATPTQSIVTLSRETTFWRSSRNSHSAFRSPSARTALSRYAARVLLPALLDRISQIVSDTPSSRAAAGTGPKFFKPREPPSHGLPGRSCLSFSAPTPALPDGPSSAYARAARPEVRPVRLIGASIKGLGEDDALPAVPHPMLVEWNRHRAGCISLKGDQPGAPAGMPTAPLLSSVPLPPPLANGSAVPPAR